MPKKQTAASGSTEEAVKEPAASAEATVPKVPKVPAPAPEVSAPAAHDVIATNKAHVAVGSKAEQMRDKLKAEPKVRVLIPLAQGEKSGVTQSVILNGYSLYIRKGEYVEVPESVADVLDVKLKHKLAVDNHPLRVSGKGEVKMDQFGGI